MAKTKPENKAKNTGHMQALNKLAGEINAKLNAANASEKLAHDTRLAAAVMLAEAEKTCKLAGIKFKDWCAKHLDKSYETARKLAAIGNAPEPEKALQESRAKNAGSMKAARQNARATASKPTNSAGIVLPAGNASPATVEAKAVAALAPADTFRAYLKGLDKMERECVLRNLAQDFGFTLTPSMGAIASAPKAEQPTKH